MLKLMGQMSLFDQDSWCGKTFPAHSAATEEKTSKPCLPRSSESRSRTQLMCLYLGGANVGLKPGCLWESEPTDSRFPLPTEYTMRNFGEYPNEERGSRLSQILEASPHPKYYLSAKACQGILNRAKRRGKELPKMLLDALTRQASVSRNEPESQGGGKGILIQDERTGALSTLNNQSVCCLNDQGGSMISVSEDVAGCLRASEHGHQPSAHCNTEDEKAPVLKARDYKDPPCVYGLDRAAFNQGANAQYQFSVEEEKIGALVARCPGAVCAAVDCRNGTENPDINGTLQAKESGGTSCNCNNVCRTNAIVRRLTPMECERLQGFPDHWTDICEWVDCKGKKHKDADSPRYKALGNSIALPFWQWMADRMCKQYDRPVEMASLFDGIGGFPLVFKRAGGNPVWASEIEEFPIAVTKRRFPET